jgi:hypothetical protein
MLVVKVNDLYQGIYIGIHKAVHVPYTYHNMQGLESIKLRERKNEEHSLSNLDPLKAPSQAKILLKKPLAPSLGLIPPLSRSLSLR